MAPHFCKAAHQQPEGHTDVLIKIAGALGAYGRADTFENATLVVKEAGMTPQGLLGLLANLKESPDDVQEGSEFEGGDDPENEQTLLSSDSESSADYIDDGVEESQEEDPRIKKQRAVTIEADPKDEIDNALAGAMQ
jgi:hypothetical protein